MWEVIVKILLWVIGLDCMYVDLSKKGLKDMLMMDDVKIWVEVEWVDSLDEELEMEIDDFFIVKDF